MDFHISGLDKVGGYSMCSAPSKLDQVNGSTMDLAIKSSTWPPAHWIHNEAKVGSEVAVRIGDNQISFEFYFSLKFLIS